MNGSKPCLVRCGVSACVSSPNSFGMYIYIITRATARSPNWRGYRAREHTRRIESEHTHDIAKQAPHLRSDRRRSADVLPKCVPGSPFKDASGTGDIGTFFSLRPPPLPPQPPVSPTPAQPNPPTLPLRNLFSLLVRLIIAAAAAASSPAFLLDPSSVWRASMAAPCPLAHHGASATPP